MVDSNFSTGEVFGDFSTYINSGESLYPQQTLEIRLFANWLAGFGDLILHAAGVMVEGQGYCFAGPAGVGKSTLAASLSAIPSVTVLGEDQVILRYLDDRFWIYGTPWHLNPDMCSPMGVPLEKLFFLDRGASQPINTLSPVVGVTSILQTAFTPFYRPDAVASIMDRLELLAGQVPFYSFNHQLGSNALQQIQEA